MRVFLLSVTHFLSATGSSRSRSARPHQSRHVKRRTRAAATVWSSDWSITIATHPAAITNPCPFHPAFWHHILCGWFVAFLTRACLQKKKWNTHSSSVYWRHPRQRHNNMKNQTCDGALHLWRSISSSLHCTDITTPIISPQHNTTHQCTEHERFLLPYSD